MGQFEVPDIALLEIDRRSVRDRLLQPIARPGKHLGAAIKTSYLVSFPRKGASVDSSPAAEVQHCSRVRRVAPDDRGDKFNFLRVVLVLVQQIIIMGISSKHTQCSPSRPASATVLICCSVSAIPLGR